MHLTHLTHLLTSQKGERKGKERNVKGERGLNDKLLIQPMSHHDLALDEPFAPLLPDNNRRVRVSVPVDVDAVFLEPEGVEGVDHVQLRRRQG